MGELDCVWDLSHKGSIESSSGEFPSSPQHNNNNNSKDDNQLNSTTASFNADSVSLRHIYHPRGSLILKVTLSNHLMFLLIITVR